MLTAAEKYIVVFRSALVAGVFSFLFGTLLFVDYTARVAQDPLNSAGILDAESPAQDESAGCRGQGPTASVGFEIAERVLPAAAIQHWGHMAVVGHVVTAPVWAKGAAVLHRQLPQPQPRDVPRDPEEHIHALGRWAVAGLGGLLVLGTLGLWAGMRSSVDLASVEFGCVRRHCPRYAGPGRTATCPAAARPRAVCPAAPREPPADSPQEQPTPKPTPQVSPPAAEPPAGTEPSANPEPPKPAEMEPSATKPPPAEPPPAPKDTSPNPVPTTSAGSPTDEEWRRNWPRFRGPAGTGVSASADLPTKWDGASGEGIRWKTRSLCPATVRRSFGTSGCL